MSDMDNFLWVEEFRPKKVADCILLEPTKEVFQGFVTDGKIPKRENKANVG